ncbi:MAG: GNAT family N-acetyltransferase [Acidobacteriia bacterium]|nr:GNAT family N-acetyltransferase [Terriglobia bacterium]
MKIILYARWQDVEQIQTRWNALLKQSAADTFFLSWEWCASWWKAYGGNLQPFVLGAWQDGRLVGVAPLCVENVRRMGWTWKYLKFIGDGSQDSDYLDCFAERGLEAGFAQAVAEYLNSHRESWDYLELHGPVESSPFVAAMSAQVQGLGWTVATEDVPCLTLKLPNTWDAYVQSLKPRFRSKLRSCLSFFEQQLKLAPVECTGEDQLQQWLPAFFDLHGKRWQSKGRSGVFQGDAKRAFYFDLSRAALKSGVLQFHRLDWGERTLAFQYGFLYNNRFLLLQEGYDPDFESLRPGVALRGFRLREMIARGVEEYDFLGGVAQHKRDWGAGDKRALKIGVAWSRQAALAFAKMPATRKQFKEGLRKLVPEPLLAMRRRAKAQAESPAHASDTAARASLKGAIARAYATTPLRRLGAWVADHYQRGLHSLSLQKRETPSCQILLYHRVNDDLDPYLPSLPVDEFRSQMAYVARNCNVVTLDDIADGRIARDSSSSKHCVAITFDDGYRDNFTSAFPILKELGIPATIYLATGYVGTSQIPWYDQVCLAFKLTTRPALDLEMDGAPAGSLASQSDRLALLDRVLAWLQGLDDDCRRKAIPSLFAALGVPASLTLPNYMLSWEEVRQMKAHQITFGAHTVSHPVLSRISNAQVQQEIAVSKKTVEQKLQTPVRHFAYPFGRSFHFTQEAKQCLQQNGFSTAVTTEFGFNQPGDDPLELKRFTPWGRDRATFILQFDWYRFVGFGPKPKPPAELPKLPVAAAQANLRDVKL